MPSTARRPLVAAAVSIAALVVAGAEAFGGLPLGSTAPRLSAPRSLSVSVPSVPTPSVPSVSTPSVPSVSVPSVPSVPSGSSVPRLANGAVPSTSSVRAPSVGAQRAAGGAGGGLGSNRGAASGSGPAAGSGSSPSARASERRARVRAAARVRAQRRARAASDRRLRRDVHRFAGCLGVLPSSQRRVLGLRAGGHGAAPMSRRATARRLGISSAHVASLERSGLRTLRAAGESGACGAGASQGGSADDGTSTATALAGGPRLEPAVLLAPRPALKSPAALGRGRRGRHAVKGVHASSGPAARSAHSSAIVNAAESSSSLPAYPIGVAALVLLMAATLLVWRRREHAHPVSDAPLAPPTWFAATTQAPERPATAPEPPVAEPEAPPEQVAPEPAPMPASAPEPQRPGAIRQVAVIAASLASLIATGLLRRRRRRR